MEWPDFVLLSHKDDIQIELELRRWTKGFSPGHSIEPLFAKKHFVAPNGEWLIAEGDDFHLQRLEDINCLTGAEVVKRESERMSSLIALRQALREQKNEDIRSALEDFYRIWDMGHPLIPDNAGVSTLGYLELRNITNKIFSRFPAHLMTPGVAWFPTKSELETLVKYKRPIRESEHLSEQVSDVRHGQFSPIQQVWYDFVMELLNKRVIGFCKFCHKPFSGNQPRKNTCSPECSNALNQRNVRRRNGHTDKRGRPKGSKNKIKEGK